MARPRIVCQQSCGRRARFMTTLRIVSIVLISAAAVSRAAAQEPAPVTEAATEIAAAVSPEPEFVLPPLGMANAAAFAQVVGRPAGPPPTPEHTGLKATARE